MTDDEAQRNAARRRVVKALRAQVATIEAAAAAALSSTQDFTEALRRAEAREVAEHPDLAELNVQMDGFYDAQ